MTNHINKISTIFSSLFLSLLLASCSQGDRDFIPAKDAPVEELEESIFITGGAVKGPLTNAEINIYKFELTEGPIKDFNHALQAWFNLLDNNQIKITDGVLSLTGTSAEMAVNAIQQSSQMFGYVTELKSLKSDLSESESFTEAKQLIQNYSESVESNSEVIKEVKSILDASATLSELRSAIKKLESLTDKLLDAESFSTVKSVLNTYRSTETNPTKLNGFASALSSIETLSANASSFNLSAIKRFYNSNIYDAFINDTSLQEDPSARKNIQALKRELDTVSTVQAAKLLLEKGFRKEGNSLVKSAISTLLGKIITVDHAIEVVLSHEAFYHGFGLRDELLSVDTTTNSSEVEFKASLDEIHLNVTAIFRDKLESAFRDSLVIKDSANGDPLNRLSYGISNDQGLLPGLDIGDYRGYVYMEASATNLTIDLNSGLKPVVESMETIFHTDDILGNGNNELEDKTVYYILNGEVLRDSEGQLLTDRSLIATTGTDKLIQVRPSYFATPLTSLAFGLTLERLKDIDLLQSDYDLDSFSDNKISYSTLNTLLSNSSDIVRESTGIGFTGNVFQSIPVRLPYMQYSQEDELEAIQYRLSIENTSAFIYKLMTLTGLSSAELVNLIIEDLTDNQIDGQIKQELIPAFIGVPQYTHLFKMDPSEKYIPDTETPVSDVFYLMNAEFSSILPNENINLFQSKLSDISITSPVGGTDLDSDGVLDNDDQFPNDPTKTRDLNAGYAGIWSVNYDGSETNYMPFNEAFKFQLNVELIEGECIGEPCLGLGDISTLVIDEYSLVQSPKNNDFKLTEPDDDLIVGFTAFATTPGDYLIKAELSTAVTPIQKYTIFIPVHVLNPKDIVIKFEPAEPQPGESVSVSFKATKAICHLYQICSGLNLNDNVPDYLPLNLLSDVFSINQTVSRNGQLIPYSSVSSVNQNQQLANLSNIEVSDSVNVTVSFNAGDRSLVAASYDNIVGNNQDSDNDGIPDTIDFYPNDALCSVEKDGLLDENLDGELNSLDSPFCFASIQADATLPFDVPFLNETWFYKPSWHYIIRKNTFAASYNGHIKTPTLQGMKEEVVLFKEDPVSKRIYLVYKNGAIDYFSLETQTINEFLPPYSFNTVNSINVLGTYLLVEYLVGGESEVKLFNKSSDLAVISTNDLHPTPGNAVSLYLDDQNLSSVTNNLLSVEWVLQRVDDTQTVQQIPVQVSEDGLTLLAGQTVFGDVLNIKFEYQLNANDSLAFYSNVFVLGVSNVVFSEKNFHDDKALRLDLLGLDTAKLSASNINLFVKWYKKDNNQANYLFSLSDNTYPFIYEEFNFEYGDLARGDLYISHGNEAELLITSLEAVILGDVNVMLPRLDASKTVIDIENREFSFTLEKPNTNETYFTPVWKINDQVIEGESSYTFPTLASTNIKYGDNITVSFDYFVNGIKGETQSALVAVVASDVALSKFKLTPQVSEVGEDIALDLSAFTANELLALEAKWRINGELDASQYDAFLEQRSFVYPGSKLKYGDYVEFILQPAGSDNVEDIASAYSHIATASVGLNLASLAAQQPNPEMDIDSDGDGVPNYKDYFRHDSLCALPTEGIVDDIDLDGISDLDELSGAYITNPNLKDTDNDGLSDYDEIYIHFTNPTLADTDGDGYLDGVEIDINTDPHNDQDPGNTLNDNDFDGLSNDLELINKTKVNVFDTDGDGLSDWYEINVSLTDPLNPDSDNDKISDGAEVRITLTNPNSADTDGDGLSDGLEVVLKLNPNAQDSDGNGVLDPDKPGFDFNLSIPKILFQNDLRNYNNDFSTLLSIEQGTCFKSWLANNKPSSISYTHEEQLDSNSYQELAFISDKWSQIIRFNAQSKVFAGVINIGHYNGFASSLTYDIGNPQLMYIGFSDGWIRRYNSQTNEFTNLFNTGKKLAISTIINQGDILISEQISDDGEIQHAVFNLNTLATNPSSVTTKSFSYKNSIWLNNARQALISIDQQYSENTFIKEVFNTALNSPVISIEQVDLMTSVVSPIFVEEISGASILRFGNGLSYNLSTNEPLDNTITPFDIGISHEGHRVLSQRNSSFLEATTQTTLINDKFWRFNTQLINKNVLAVVPVGNHLLAISYEEPTNPVVKNGKIEFQHIVLGDEDSDNLPDWWNNLSDTLTSTQFDAYELTADAVIPDLLDGTPNVDDSLTPPLLVDTDGDGICDHWEVSLFGTDPLLADTDSDGLSDAEELGVNTNLPLDCKAYPVFNIKTDPLNSDSDSDGISDGDEVNVHATNPLNPDTDGDGLTDYQEIFITNTDPNVQNIDLDSDGDGLFDRIELNITNTDINNDDSDGDGLNDYDEVMLYGTNPNKQDSDGDSLSDADEINIHNTDPSSIDTDQDGLSDAVELNLNGIHPYTTNPNMPDSDGDGLSDLYEFEYRFEYADELLLTLLEQGNQILPNTITNPNSLDTDGDGICDKWEITLFLTNPAEADTDGDGLTDAEELGIKEVGVALPPLENCDEPTAFLPISDPLNRDTDGDGILDGDEVLTLFTDPKDKDTDDNGINDGDEDFDSDNLTNFQELYLTQTDPWLADSNGNGIRDDLDDADGDGLSNYDEINIHGTDPNNADTDGDGINDKDEIDSGLNPILDDSDGDGLSDSDEINIYGTDPTKRDTDNDGLSDGEEIILRTNPLDPDTDNDFLIDGLDKFPLNPDADSDGIPDGIEFHYLNTSYELQDSDKDGLDDGYEAWVFAYTYDEATQTTSDSLVQIGENSDIDLNSKRDVVSWPAPVKFEADNKERLIMDLVDVLDPTIIRGKLYIQRYSDPAKQDSDGDGLLDSTEFEIERVFGVEYHETLNQGSFDPLATNAENFKVSDPWNIRTGVVADIDSDGDGIPDFYELKYTLTDPNNPDTDSNGILDGLENKDGDLLNNQQEILFGSDPNLNDVTLEIYGIDSDGDGLLDIFETKLFDNYDINSQDSNGNGIPDGLEDPDGDSLTNIEEMKFQTDPLTKDTGLDSDGDGLTDYQEIFMTLTDPNLADTDSNGVSDADEDPDGDGLTNLQEVQLGSDPHTITDRNNILDSDNDGLTDYQEINLTMTDPFNADTDGNGITDAYEDLDSDGLTNFQEMKLGTNPLVSDSHELRKDTDGDGLVDVYEIKITNTDPLLSDSNSDGIPDGQSDLDNDGLTEFVELLFGTDPLVKNTAIDSDNDGLTDVQERLLTLTNPSLYDTNGSGISDGDEDLDNDGLSNLEEMALFTDPLTVDLTDAQNDADGDFYNNLYEQDDSNTSVTNPDTDNDSLPDGLEVLLLGTNPSHADTDLDGLNDQTEIKSWSYREILTTEFCEDTEVRLAFIAGKDYCFSVEYYSYPTLVDSDNDGVPDRGINSDDSSIIIDHYPLDASCHLAEDGFTRSDQSTQCYSSWMAESPSIDIIEQAQWEDTSGAAVVSHADIMFFSTGWNAIISHNALTGTYNMPVEIKTEINSTPVNLIDFEFNKADKSLYLLYSDSTIESYNVETKVMQTLGIYQLFDTAPRTLKVLNSDKLLVESVKASSKLSYTLIDSSGANLAVMDDQDLSLDESAIACLNANLDCNQSVSIFGFIKDMNGANINIGRLDINTSAGSFIAIESSNMIAVDDAIEGPIKLSQDRNRIQFGSGQIFDLQLVDTSETLTRTHNDQVYNSYYDFIEYADHFVGIVDVDLSTVPGSGDVSPAQNGLFVSELESIKVTLEQKLPVGDSINDLKVLNQYLLPPETLEQEVLKLIPFTKIPAFEMALIRRSNKGITIDSLGLFDEDNDLMTGLYERVFGLDDTDAGDKFLDLDNDGLSNIEEYFFATDPSKEDTDGDGWMDIDEILNGTDPNNKLSY